MFRTTAMVHLTNRRQALAALQRAETRGFYTKTAILAALGLGLVSLMGTTDEAPLHRQLPQEEATGSEQKEANQLTELKAIKTSGDYNHEQNIGDVKLEHKKTVYLYFKQNHIGWKKKGMMGVKSRSKDDIQKDHIQQAKIDGNELTFRNKKKWYKFVFDNDELCKFVYSKITRVERPLEAVRCKEVLTKAIQSPATGLSVWKEIHEVYYSQYKATTKGSAARLNDSLSKIKKQLFTLPVEKWMRQCGFEDHYAEEVEKLCKQSKSFNLDELRQKQDKIQKQMGLIRDRKEFKQKLDEHKITQAEYDESEKAGKWKMLPEEHEIEIQTVEIEDKIYARLLAATGSILTKLDENRHSLPESLRVHLAGMLDGLKSDPSLATMQLGSTLFLRLINPILVKSMAKSKGACGDKNKRYAWMEITFVLQKLANQIEFETKTCGMPYMDPDKPVGKTYLELKAQMAKIVRSAAQTINVEAGDINVHVTNMVAQAIRDDEIKDKEIAWIAKSLEGEIAKSDEARELERLQDLEKYVYTYNTSNRKEIERYELQKAINMGFHLEKVGNAEKDIDIIVEEGLDCIVNQTGIKPQKFEYQYLAKDAKDENGDILLIISTKKLTQAGSDE